MSIAWNEALALGDAAIDADHRRMISLIADLETAARGLAAASGVAGVLRELTELCREHFAREEALQRSVGYPRADSHRTAHEMLMKRLDSIRTHYEAGCDEVRAGIVRTLGDSLATWLINHILDADMAFKPYVTAMQEA